MSKIKKPFELKVQTTIKALIYGQPGSRKSTLALSSPAPLMLDFDGGIHRVDSRHQTDTVQVESWEDVLEALGEDLTPFKTIIIDTAGKMLDYMSAYIIKNDPKMGQRDGSLSLKGFGARKAMFVNFLHQVSRMGKHLVFVAHEREEKDGDTKIIRPEIGGSSAGDLIKELDLVGYIQSIGNKKTVSFEPCEKFYGKNTCKLPASIDLIQTLDTEGVKQLAQNNQLSQIFDTYAKTLQERKVMADEYAELMQVIMSKVEAIEDADTANEVAAWANEYPSHIWDSKFQAALRINEKAKSLNLKLNKEKQYEPATAAAA